MFLSVLHVFLPLRGSQELPPARTRTEEQTAKWSVRARAVHSRSRQSLPSLFHPGFALPQLPAAGCARCYTAGPRPLEARPSFRSDLLYLPDLTQPVPAWAWLGLRISLFSDFVSLWCSFGRRGERTDGRTDTESRTSESPFNLLIMRQGEWPPARPGSAGRGRPSVFLCLNIYHRSSSENFLNSCLLSFPPLP